MSRCCPNARLRTVHDGCIKIIKHCTSCGAEYTQTKRRKAGFTLEQCYWQIPCADHPKQPPGKVVITVDGDETYLEVDFDSYHGYTDITMVNEGLHASMRITPGQRDRLISALQEHQRVPQ